MAIFIYTYPLNLFNSTAYVMLDIYIGSTIFVSAKCIYSADRVLGKHLVSYIPVLRSHIPISDFLPSSSLLVFQSGLDLEPSQARRII